MLCHAWRVLAIICLCLSTITAWGYHESIVPSTNGAYIVYTYWPNSRQKDDNNGIWVYSVSTSNWKRVWPRPAYCEWLPDNSRIVIQGGGTNATYFKFLSPEGEPSSLPTLPRSCNEWKVLPDGSGIVATNYRIKADGIEIWRLSFDDTAWKLITSYPRSDWDKGTGDHLVLRKAGDDWVLSCHESGPSDSRSLWVNLTTGNYALGDEGDPLFEYSPDGQYAIANAGRIPGVPTCIWHAYSWPQADQDRTVLYDPLILSDTLGIHSGQWQWAPDSKAFFGISEVYARTGKPTIRYVVIGMDGTAISTGNGRALAWAGNDKILVEDHELKQMVIRSTNKQPDTTVIPPPWQR